MFPHSPTKDEQIRWSQSRSPFHRVHEEIHRSLFLSQNLSSSQDISQNISHPVMPIFEPRELFTMRALRIYSIIHTSFTAYRAFSSSG
ncbi:hypothetical protein HanPI659440_Chr08g0285241 [Helianthus annuus]|nr:hypothetical protein HanPI659440_Chr08g0285241 [Helianthus annuus]